MTIKNIFSFFITSILISTQLACQTIVSISNSEMDVKKGKEVNVSDSRLGYFNLIVPDISVNEKLAKNCIGGTVTGVETILLKRELFIVQIYDLMAKASCQDPVITTPNSIKR